jgi:hypothetical protein
MCCGLFQHLIQLILVQVAAAMCAAVPLISSALLAATRCGTVLLL